jgi:solute carrier family 41
MVTSTSMASAALSSVILGSFMCLLVVLCRKRGLDPDNIAPPIASCLGDLVTLSLLGVVSAFLLPFLYTPVPFIVMLLVICVAIACFLRLMKSGPPEVRSLIKEGWSPLFGAMIISSGTGIVLDMFVSRYEGFGLLAVVISGKALPRRPMSSYADHLVCRLAWFSGCDFHLQIIHCSP